MERNCKNCKKLLYAQQNYCSHCGSKWVEYRLTPRKITAELSNRYLGTDNVFLVTILGLLRYPEDVINGYISGQRKKYVNPINFYLISLSLVGLQIFLLRHFAPDTLGMNVAEITNVQNNTGQSLENFTDFFYDYIGAFTTFFLPAYALSGYIIFLDIRKYNFTEHLILYVYVFALVNIVTFVATPLMIGFDIPYQMVSLALTPFIFLQVAWYYKRCFKLDVQQTVLKGLLAIIVFNVISAILMIIVIIIAVALLFFFNSDLLNTAAAH
ncbi:uncharacterized protein DUF3667 [Nonlabens xylanidelens]|uniref:Uncharacterized protein DUF3667 n=1 Tax=Nonlabens xylanidelens TaxID=191564 RepID=A0A2S6IHA9_9FLAO|nr:DUF3667 domain-containing protein [Nonlabens xylanidelens]PPK93592.1 uncharacterized protein DUF3667 [Nonlabens xylanidelens]PQJ17825.1 hypothetical protein BST94_12400 [Nonlabens xylanidelens]